MMDKTTFDSLVAIPEPIKRLDFALKIIYDHNDYMIALGGMPAKAMKFGGFLAKWRYNDTEELRRAIMKLLKDDYIYLENPAEPDWAKWMYSITYDGVVFYLADGYAQALRNELWAASIQSQNHHLLARNVHLQKNLNRLTFWIVCSTLITGVQGFFEIPDFFQNTALWILIIGAISTLFWDDIQSAIFSK